MFSAGPWLYSVVNFAGSSLVVAAYVAGLVITFRRWHLGAGARLAAIGFALLVFTLVGNLIFYSLQGFIFSGSSDDALFLRLAAVGALTALLSAAGVVLVVLGLRTALVEITRLRAEPRELREADMR